MEIFKNFLKTFKFSLNSSEQIHQVRCVFRTQSNIEDEAFLFHRYIIQISGSYFKFSMGNIETSVAIEIFKTKN